MCLRYVREFSTSDIFSTVGSMLGQRLYDHRVELSPAATTRHVSDVGQMLVQRL